MVLFIYLGFYITFNTEQVISRWVVGRAEETSTYSWSSFCTVNCRPTASNYQLSHLRACREPNPRLRGGGQSVSTLPPWPLGVQMGIDANLKGKPSLRGKTSSCEKKTYEISTTHMNQWDGRMTSTFSGTTVVQG